MTSDDNLITYNIQEIENENDDNIELFEIKNYKDLIDEMDNLSVNVDNDMIMPLMLNYSENYTIKDLMTICDFYGFTKVIKVNKLNKEDIINYIIRFELDPTNASIVFKRQNMWFYINELKNDKFMKKFVIW